MFTLLYFELLLNFVDCRALHILGKNGFHGTTLTSEAACASASREDDKLIITPLGAGNEVGRSCVYMSYKGKTVLFDCGIHPAYSGMAALPYFDEIDPSIIDVLLITHFHLDHAASLPYFLEKTTFKGRVFMTYATKAIYKLLLTDYVKVSKVSVEDMLFDEQDINASMDKIEVIDFHQTVEVAGIRFWCYTAGHVLGAAMFMVDIAGVRVLYTGDYSREEDRHLRAAETPQFSPDICIIESTYGVQHHQPRHIRESDSLMLSIQPSLKGVVS
ncbi:cleavage and polyadenylation specificity factor subunit 3-I [Prunus yedoensis var. nudiflora]|uniref:Cleavage and polyadenylation specificity factor subunit 3-I n=1 Tax=Prunus yedoensis var. nudiflora TaxID=2094558 RepID=A0A314Y6V8_PRUYE|nr:cleavage and polyadenylation specificity factor subunit 3-I [Prunus yedoensis var. nudiflora]